MWPFNTLPEEYFPMISDYAKILLPSIITYFATRYSLNRPKKYEIRTKQFELVYLPLYLLSRQLVSNTSKPEDIQIFIRKTDKIIYKNYPFVFPKTEKLFKKMKAHIMDQKSSAFYISDFVYQIESDYEKLKRELGYPTDSLIEFFNRLNKFDRFIYLCFFAFSAIGIYFCISSISLFFTMDIANALTTLFCSLSCFFLAYLMYYAQH